MKSSIAALFILVLLSSCVRAQEMKNTITVDGITRTFVIYQPSGINPAQKLPLIISLHGRLGAGEGEMRFADFRPIADRDKFLVVCPDGIDRSWNDGRNTPAHKKGINDVKFIDELITYMIKNYHADPERVYVTGMSNGGFMTSRLACQLYNRIAAVAIVAASMDEGMDYSPQHPMPVMYIQGTADPLVPYSGGEMKGAGGEIYSHEDMLRTWARTDGCRSTPLYEHLKPEVDDGTSITRETFTNPASGAEVIGYTVMGGGHTWPGGTQYLPRFVIGRLSHNLNACEVIWDFFKGYRLVD